MGFLHTLGVYCISFGQKLSSFRISRYFQTQNPSVCQSASQSVNDHLWHQIDFNRNLKRVLKVLSQPEAPHPCHSSVVEGWSVRREIRERMVRRGGAWWWELVTTSSPSTGPTGTGTVRSVGRIQRLTIKSSKYNCIGILKSKESFLSV